ncbi:YIP1 family protein [Rhodobacterales bacterium HKCCE2091]|nr:YIP1 family protein [Rhodobacterales bacterium HKCCE2091]
MTRLPTIRELLAHVRLTIGNPRAGAADVLAAMPPREALWYFFALVVVITVFLGEIVFMIASAPEGEVPQVSVLGFGAVQAGFLLLLAVAVHRVGRAFGGAGTFAGALALVTWLQFIFILVQIVQVVLLLVAPPLSDVVLFLSTALFFWLLVSFIAELHGFASLGRVFLGVIATFIVLALVLSLLARALGIHFFIA